MMVLLLLVMMVMAYLSRHTSCLPYCGGFHTCTEYLKTVFIDRFFGRYFQLHEAILKITKRLRMLK